MMRSHEEGGAVLCVAGARPKFMKIAPVIREMKGAAPPLPARILADSDDILRTGGRAGRVPEFWDGHASTRIARVLGEWLNRNAGEQRAA